jgi:hypothetical protein
MWWFYTPNKDRESQRSDLDARLTDRQWELYRRSIIEKWPESAHKAAVSAAINYKLMILDLEEKGSIEVPDHPRYADDAE